MRRILVPVDFSTTSKKAFRFAMEIVSKTDGLVTLYHLFTPAKKNLFGSQKSVEDYNKKTTSNALKRLKRLKKKVLEETGAKVVVNTFIGRTPVINNILGFAEHNHIDMIVMGTQGASGLKKVIIGSVAAKIISESELPVILIPEKFEMKDIENVVYLTDLQKGDKKVLPLVFDFAGLYDASLQIINLFLKLHNDDSSGKKDFASFEKYIHKKFNTSNTSLKQIETRSIAKSLENLASEMPYEVLAMARRKLKPGERLFQKSFTREMAFMTNRPLLVIPEG